MANRAYLYAEWQSQSAPGTEYMDISEWDSSIPLSYKILMSDHPEMTKSVIFDAENAAVVSRYDGGVRRLLKFLEDAGYPASHPEVVEITNKLGGNIGLGYSLRLEPLEIFSLSKDDEKGQMAQLISDINGIEQSMADYSSLIKSARPKVKLLDKILKSKHSNRSNMADDMLYDNGFGFWCDILYCSLENRPDSECDAILEERDRLKREMWRKTL